MNAPRYFALIPAAGAGTRMGADHPKQYLEIAGKPMLRHVLDTFSAVPAINHVFVVVSEGDAHIERLCRTAPPLSEKVSVLYEGGATRQESVLNGLRSLREQVADGDWVLVHDAARPGLTSALIEKLLFALRDDEVGGLLAMPVVDTLKRADRGRASGTVPREGLWSAQTPQMFRYALLRRALELADHVTDEASAVEAMGLQPKLVEGDARNFKLTLPGDVGLAEMYLCDARFK